MIYISGYLSAGIFRDCDDCKQIRSISTVFFLRFHYKIQSNMFEWTWFVFSIYKLRQLKTRQKNVCYFCYTQFKLHVQFWSKLFFLFSYVNGILIFYSSSKDKVTANLFLTYTLHWQVKSIERFMYIYNYYVYLFVWVVVYHKL